MKKRIQALVASITISFACHADFLIQENSSGTQTDMYSWEPVSRTITFATTDGADDIQTTISNVGRHIPTGVSITFQFDTSGGTWNLSHELSFKGFYGGGNIYIQGNTNEGISLYSTQNCFLDFESTSGGSSGLLIQNCHLTIIVQNLKIEIDDSSNAKAAILFRGCSGEIWSRYNYLLAEGKSQDNSGLEARYTNYVYAYRNYVSNVKYGIYSNGSRIMSDSNDDTGVAPTYGLLAGSAGVIGKNSTQPSGTAPSSADEYTVTGGEIR